MDREEVVTPWTADAGLSGWLPAPAVHLSGDWQGKPWILAAETPPTNHRTSFTAGTPGSQEQCGHDQVPTVLESPSLANRQATQSQCAGFPRAHPSSARRYAHGHTGVLASAVHLPPCS